MADEKKFGEGFMEFLDKVMEGGKKGLKATGEAISDFGDKSVVRIELSQLKTKLSKAHIDLGKNIYNKITVQNMTQINVSDDLELAGLVDAIRKLEEDIAKHEDSLKTAKDEKKTAAPENPEGDAEAK